MPASRPVRTEKAPLPVALTRLSRLWVPFVLLWLCGIALRITVLAVPPVISEIHRDLHLTETLVGALTALPILLLALVSVPGSLLIARIGARRALIAGMLMVAVGGAARGLGTSTAILFAMTLVMGAGIAVSQPALPSLVREWLPEQVPRATAVFSNGFLIGEILAAGLTGSVLLSVLGSWQAALALWSLAALITVAGIALWTPHVERGREDPPVQWWPNWRSGLTWRLGLTLGCASITYFGANAFVPDFLRATHHSGLITPALTSLNLGQLPASFVVAATPERLVARRWPIVAAGVLILISVAGIQLPGPGVVLWMAVLGFSPGLIFILSMTLPPLLAAPNDVHRLSAAMFTIAYTCSFLGSTIGGALWDHLHQPFTAFLPIVVAGAAMILLTIGLEFHQDGHRPE